MIPVLPRAQAPQYITSLRPALTCGARSPAVSYRTFFVLRLHVEDGQQLQQTELPLNLHNAPVVSPCALSDLN